MKECDNLIKCHNPIVEAETPFEMRVFCKDCKHTYYIRKNPNTEAPDNKVYSKIFKKDILQGHDNLFYKYYPQYLKV